MGKFTQLGIVMGLFGAVLVLIGLFPGVVGLEQTREVGIIQILVILAGFSALIVGAYVFVQGAFYPGVQMTLAQQIATRISMTGLVIATAAGLSDILGFGSNPPIPPLQRPYVGPIQAFGLVAGFLIASSGVLVFAVMGNHEPPAPMDGENME